MEPSVKIFRRVVGHPGPEGLADREFREIWAENAFCGCRVDFMTGDAGEIEKIHLALNGDSILRLGRELLLIFHPFLEVLRRLNDDA